MLNPFGNADPQTAQILQANVSDYVARTARAVELLAEGCGLDPERERERFDGCRQALVHETPLDFTTVAGGLSQLTSLIGASLPGVFEMVLAHRGDAARFGYLTQGGTSTSLPVALGELLRATLQIYLGGGGSTDQGELLADVFRIIFPDLDALKSYSAVAQGMVVGFGPAGDHIDVKAYFNTRLDHSTAHANKVLAACERAGIADGDVVEKAYRVLYADTEAARFSGIGVDLVGPQKQRGKLYVRIDTEQALEHLARVADAFEIDVDATGLERHFTADCLANEQEIAVALRADGTPTVKLTLFFAGSEAEATRAAVISFMEEVGHPTELFERTCDALQSAGGRGTTRVHPVHGLGIEYPEESKRKVNLYLTPVI